MARHYARLGDHDNALRWLESAYELRSSMLIWLEIERLCLAKTRLTCIFNNFARHSPTHYFPDQNSHLALRDR